MKWEMDIVKSIAEDMRKEIDRRMEETLFSSFPQFSAQPKEVNIIEELNKAKDRITTVILCNSDEQEELQALVDKESGFYKIIGQPYIEKGQAVIVKDEKLKMSLLRPEEAWKINIDSLFRAKRKDDGECKGVAYDT